MNTEGWTKKDWKAYEKSLNPNDARIRMINTGRRPSKPNHNWIAVDGMPGAKRMYLL
jgi:hypothetical protein